MSDLEQEPVEGAEEPQEGTGGDEDAEGADDGDEAQEGEGEPEEGVEQPEVEQPSGMTEKELEKAHAKIVAENERHAGRVGQIMGEDAQDLIPCPLCSGFVAGLIFPVQPPDEVKARTLLMLGMGPTGEFKRHPQFAECSACGGEGKVETGSKVFEYVTKNCPDCQGTGFVRNDGKPSAATNGTVEVHPAFDNPPVPPPDEPAWIEEAKRAGYTIVPPFQGLTPVP